MSRKNNRLYCRLFFLPCVESYARIPAEAVCTNQDINNIHLYSPFAGFLTELLGLKFFNQGIEIWPMVAFHAVRSFLRKRKYSGKKESPYFRLLKGKDQPQSFNQK